MGSLHRPDAPFLLGHPDNETSKSHGGPPSPLPFLIKSHSGFCSISTTWGLFSNADGKVREGQGDGGENWVVLVITAFHPQWNLGPPFGPCSQCAHATLSPPASRLPARLRCQLSGPRPAWEHAVAFHPGPLMSPASPAQP